MNSNSLMPYYQTLREIRQDPEHWRRAAAAWLASKASANTRDVYGRAVQRFFADSGKEPWQVAGSDVVAWQSQLRAQGLKASSINLYLAALSSFYHYAANRYTLIDPETGREEPLATGNPAHRPERAKVTPYGHALSLDSDQVQLLIGAINRSTVGGARDYALMVAYVLTGARNSELRRLRWGDLEQEGDRIVWQWTGKGGKSERREFPWPAYHLITDYLRLAGRLETIRDGEYVFTAHSEAAGRLPNVDEPGAAGEAPLSGGMVNQLVKKYARWAGIRGRVTTHTLRHSAAMLRRDHTTDLQDIQRFLHHSNLATTQIYIDHVTIRTDTVALKVAAQLGIQ